MEFSKERKNERLEAVFGAERHITQILAMLAFTYYNTDENHIDSQYTHTNRRQEPPGLTESSKEMLLNHIYFPDSSESAWRHESPSSAKP